MPTSSGVKSNGPAIALPTRSLPSAQASRALATKARHAAKARRYRKALIVPSPRMPPSSLEPLRRRVDEGEVGVFLHVELGFYEAERALRLHVVLQRREIGARLRIAVEVAAGVEEAADPFRRLLGGAGDDCDHLVAVGGVERPADAAEIILEEIGHRRAVLVEELGARGQCDHL